MRITYTSPVRGHQYRYANEFHRLNVLYAHITGVSRFTHRRSYAHIQQKTIHKDFWQSLHLLGYKYNAPSAVTSFLGELANRSIDSASYYPSLCSDVLLFYRTTGLRTAVKIREENHPCLTVMEEVNSHVDQYIDLMREECWKSGYGKYYHSTEERDRRLLAYEQSDLILCPSSFVYRSFVEKGFPAEKLIRINYGFDLSICDSSGFSFESSEDEVFRLLYVGQLNYRKGIRYALEAFRRLNHPQKEFILVGPLTPKTGFEGISMPEGVKIAGILKGTALANAYRHATAFVLPSIEEGLALVLGEAMAAGLPIVTTTNSGGDDLIANGLQGFITPPADVNALHDAFEKLASDRSLTKQMGQYAQQKARDLGDWSVAAGKLVKELRRASAIKALI